MKIFILLAILNAISVWAFSSGQNSIHDIATIIGWISIAISTALSYILFKQSQPYYHEFSEKNWSECEAGFSLDVPNKLHKKSSSASITVYMKTDNSYEEVGLDKICNSDKSVTIKAATRFSGKIIIK